MKRAALLAVVGGLTCALACEKPSSPRQATPATGRPEASPPAAPAPTFKSDDAAPQERQPPDLDPLAFVTDRQVLQGLEQLGFDLASLLGSTSESKHSTAELASLSKYQDIIGLLRQDVEAVRASDKLAGEDMARFSHRLFDMKRLNSDIAHFELVALVNRLDRRPFHRKSGACGEVRLIYRLAYETEVHPRGAPTKRVRSRLPMTIGLEFAGPSDADDESCQKALARFSPPENLQGADLAKWLASDAGPLRAVARADNSGLQVVVNLQVVRWPSTVHPSMAGHAEYVLRAFAPHDTRLRPVLLENTPDSAKLLSDRKLKTELVELLAEPEALRALDAGTLFLPDKFLTTKAVSVTPRGFSRLANRPYRSFLSVQDVSHIDLKGLRHVKSAEALIRRLDDLSCTGCHQARSVAGFHVLGEDGPKEAVGNALMVPFSPHVEEDLPRRKKLFSAIAASSAPDYSRAFAERAGGGGGYGAHCGLGGQFAEWTCDEGLKCDPYDAPQDDRTVGICLPEAGPFVGDPCEVGVVQPNRNGRRDRVVSVRRSACVEAACNKNAVGFPGGLCRSTCSNPGPHGTCGSIAMLGPFNACLARHEPFTECLKHAAPAGLRRCGPGDPCRDDFICARKDDDEGMCLPPYFLFQLRVDGHP